MCASAIFCGLLARPLAATPTAMRRSFHLSMARRTARATVLKSMAIVRLPTVLLPDQALTICNHELPPAALVSHAAAAQYAGAEAAAAGESPARDSLVGEAPMSLLGDGPLSLVSEAPMRAIGDPPIALAAFGPGASVGVEIDTMLAVDENENSSDSEGRGDLGESLIVGGSRMRLLRERPSHDRTTTIGIFQRVVDQAITPARAARLLDEAHRARELSEKCEEQWHLIEGRAAGCELLDASHLSLWLAARLPLAPRLLVDVVSSTCPLGRLQDVVDAMHLLVEPNPRRSRPAHRFRVVETPEGTLQVEKAKY